LNDNMRTRQIAALASVSLLCLGASLSARAAAQYSIVDLGDLGAGYSVARAINGQGLVVGEALLPVTGQVYHAFLWQAGTMNDLGTSGGQLSRAFGVNSAGTVSGWAQTPSGNSLPALWNGSAVTQLPTLGGGSGTAWSINDTGIAVGGSSLSGGVSHASLWSDGKVRDLGTLGGTISVAYDINNRGAAVGTAYNSAGQERAVLWGDSGPVDLGGLSGGQWIAASAINDLGQVILWGTPQGAAHYQAAFWNGSLSSPVLDLGSFGGGQSFAYGLNDLGYVVGADDSDGPWNAFVWDGTAMTKLGTLGGISATAYGINDYGVIVGYATDASGSTHAVEWLPVPEPTSLLVGLLGGGMFGLTICLKKRSRPRPPARPRAFLTRG
jgi:probable HAF family extracellular repeat protein